MRQYLYSKSMSELSKWSILDLAHYAFCTDIDLFRQGGSAPQFVLEDSNMQFMQSLGKFRPTLRFQTDGRLPIAWVAKGDAAITNKFIPTFPIRSQNEHESMHPLAFYTKYCPRADFKTRDLFHTFENETCSRCGFNKKQAESLPYKDADLKTHCNLIMERGTVSANQYTPIPNPHIGLRPKYIEILSEYNHVEIQKFAYSVSLKPI